MDRIEGASVGRCAASPYLRPLTLHYRQNGAQKSWDFMKTHDRSGVGLTGSRQTMFYTEVTDAQRSGPGGGLAEEGELIEVVHLPLEGAQAFADDPDIPKTLGVIFGVSWFLSQVAPNLDLQ
ncbi:uridine diphosphate glucose pyrophosphatase NUDT14 isoform X3 [Macaca fascicularis]|uniref:uridine diphosphate glucose pyrophosphatase NUDT14 isoform X3 n=1 Tax=Macaca fascicularis TaxID=9541 RepID=UPI003D15DCE1